MQILDNANVLTKCCTREGMATIGGSNKRIHILQVRCKRRISLYGSKRQKPLQQGNGVVVRHGVGGSRYASWLSAWTSTIGLLERRTGTRGESMELRRTEFLLVSATRYDMTAGSYATSGRLEWGDRGDQLPEAEVLAGPRSPLRILIRHGLKTNKKVVYNMSFVSGFSSVSVPDEQLDEKESVIKSYMGFSALECSQSRV